MEPQLAAYLALRLETETVSIAGMRCIPGGASRETWMFDVGWTDTAGKPRSDNYILQKDVSVGLVESERPAEFVVYRTMHAAGIPVPRPLWLEPKGDVLGEPFMIMERLPNVEASPAIILSPAYDSARDSIGRHMYEILGAIHCVAWEGTEIEAAVGVPSPGSTAERETAYWEDMIDRHEPGPQPVARAAIR